ncbi:MAG: flagellar hook-length control protein FliK [Desulfovibrionaceae bacterium]|nr:flagellar hook-length control protein FliK [Desulfovibrionaceae bacterium]
MQFLPADFSTFNPAGILSSMPTFDYEMAEQNRTSFQRLLERQQAEQDAYLSQEQPAQGTMDREDLIALRDSLSEQGVSADRLDRLNALAESGRGVTPEEVEKALLGIELDGIDTSLTHDLTDTEKGDLRSFLSKLGFGRTEIDSIMDELAQGGDLKAWNLLESKLASLSLDQSLEIAQREISALARAFRLSESQRTQLEGIFASGFSGNSVALADAISLLKTEMVNRGRSDMLLADGETLKETIADVLALSKARKEVEDKSGNRQSQLAQRMDTRIKDTVNSQGDALPQAALNQEGEGVEGLRERGLRDEQQENAPGKEKAEQQYRAGQKSGNGETASSRTSENGEGFLNRVINADPSILGGSRAQNTEGARAQAASFANNLFQQVEQGLFKTIQDGIKQLTLQLEPGDLGTMTLVVSVREKEVSAIIRPDSMEAAKLVEEQLHRIRQALESQGLKVENLEVQSNVAERDAQRGWEGLEKHNFTRQELEYRERARLLHRLRQADNSLAQEMQNISAEQMNAANISRSEIYIVA